MRDRDYEFEEWDESDRNFVLTLMLCIFLGVLGIHRFYVGKIGTGILMLLTGALGGIWWLVDIVMIAMGKFQDRDGLVIRP